MTLLKNKSIFFQLVFLAGLVAIDQSSKHFVLQFLEVLQEGNFLNLSFSLPVENYNFIFGFDFQANQLFIMTTLSAVLCLVVFFYTLYLIYISKFLPSVYPKIGITLVSAGFISNVLNKVITGHTIDFIKWSPFKDTNIYFNFADIFQTAGWIILLFQIFFFRKYIWRTNEKRKKFLILKTDQIEFILMCLWAFICLSSSFLIVTYQFLTSLTLTEFQNINNLVSSFLPYSFLMLFVVCFLMILFFVYVSNKIYGPIYAFEKYTQALLRGENPKDLQLRKNDQLKNLEKLASDIKNKLKVHT